MTLLLRIPIVSESPISASGKQDFSSARVRVAFVYARRGRNFIDDRTDETAFLLTQLRHVALRCSNIAISYIGLSARWVGRRYSRLCHCVRFCLSLSLSLSRKERAVEHLRPLSPVRPLVAAIDLGPRSRSNA